MPNRTFEFSRNEGTQHQLTPLGAAIVEALPDRKKVAKIRRDFKRRGYCPASAVFTKEAAVVWAALRATTEQNVPHSQEE